jgi:hypothetical protein
MSESDQNVMHAHALHDHKLHYACASCYYPGMHGSLAIWVFGFAQPVSTPLSHCAYQFIVHTHTPCSHVHVISSNP